MKHTIELDYSEYLKVFTILNSYAVLTSFEDSAESARKLATQLSDKWKEDNKG